MRNDFTIGLVVPFASDTVPDEGLQMYPGVRFVPRGVGVRSLTPRATTAPGRDLPAAEYLAKQDVDAIMVIGTSLTFYRGSDFHARAPGEAARDDRPAGEHHEPSGRRRAAPFRRPADRGRDCLCR